MANAKKCDRCGILYDLKDYGKYQSEKYKYHIKYIPDGKEHFPYSMDLCSGCQCMLYNFIKRKPLDEDLVMHTDKDYIVDYVGKE